MALADPIRDIIAKLPPEAQPLAADTMDFLTTQGEAWFREWAALVQAKHYQAARRKMLACMTPTQIVAEQLADRPFLVALAWSNHAARKERERIIKDAWELAVNIGFELLFGI